MTQTNIYRESGLGDGAIAERMGVSRVTVWRWRPGKLMPAAGTLPRLSDVLGCSPADLRPDLAALFSEAKK